MLIGPARAIVCFLGNRSFLRGGEGTLTIRAVSPVGGAFDPARMQTAGSPRPVDASRSAGSESSTGPVFLFGGSTFEYIQGLYDSLGKLLDTAASPAPSGTSLAESVSEEQGNAVVEFTVNEVNSVGVDPAEGFSTGEKSEQALAALQEAVRVTDESRMDAVIACLEEVAEDQPQADMPHNLLGRALKKAGRLDEAVDELRIAAGLAPYNLGYIADLADVYIARAEAKVADGKPLTANADVDAARAIDPANCGLAEASARLAADRAGRAMSSRQYNKVLSELRKAAAGAPDDVHFRKTVAALYVRAAQHFKSQGGNSVALSSFERAYELDPTSVVARDNVAGLSHTIGMTALNGANYDRAITYLTKAFNTYRPDDTYGQDLARAYDLRGQQRLSLGKLDEAIEDFTKGITLDPTSSSLNAHLSAAVLQKNGS